MSYDEDLKPLYDIVNIVFTSNIEPALYGLVNKYKNEIFKNENARDEIDSLIKTNALVIKKYFSKNYYNIYLKKYFSDDGIVFFIVTNLSAKSQLLITELISK